MTGVRIGRGGIVLLLLTICGVLAGCDDEKKRDDGKSEIVPPSADTPAAPRIPEPVELVWPTPNDIYLRGGDVEQFIQPTVSGVVTSGLFGSVRNGGRRFHEGIDLSPLERDARGEPVDIVGAAMAGVVRHINAREGASSYGRYVVLEHPEQSPPVYTLYAHLARIAADLRIGRAVAAGEPLGTMGRSAGGYVIPKNRAHLHFEIGLRVSDRFQEWYDSKDFGSPNEHGLWNGMNLMGLDPLAFFARRRAGSLNTLDEVFVEAPIAVVLRIAEQEEPDFVRRYPSLVESRHEFGAGWEIQFDATGVPVRWRQLGELELIGWRKGEIRILQVNKELLQANPSRRLIATVRGKSGPAADLNTVIEQLWPHRR
jgi:Membrane proteins related to metalloendopeptidases